MVIKYLITIYPLKFMIFQKILLTKVIFIWLNFCATAQTKGCNSNFDSVSILKLANTKSWMYKNKHLSEAQQQISPVYQTKLYFDEAKCEWHITSTKYATTKKGDCKNTNGCTIVYKLTTIVDAQSGKRKGKIKEKKTIPNFE